MYICFNKSFNDPQNKMFIFITENKIINQTDISMLGIQNDYMSLWQFQEWCEYHVWSLLKCFNCWLYYDCIQRNGNMKIIHVRKSTINIYDISINTNEIKYKISFNMKTSWYNRNVKELLRNERLKIFFWVYICYLFKNDTQNKF